MIYASGILLDVEIDGPQHEHDRDIARDRLFLIHGVQPVRFSASDAYEDPHLVVAEVVALAQAIAVRGWT